jgi:poly(3-hydroxybutyrate) depolymerase
MYSYNSSQLYHLLESTRANLSPMRYAIIAAQEWYESQYNPLYNSNFGQTMRATLEIAERISRKYSKPEFNITSAMINDKSYPVEQNVVLKKPFCNLLHFDKKIYTGKQPKLLIIAPMAGHHATLLRGTVQEMLLYADVYITDWIDASQVPLSEGGFNMDDFIDYIIEFVKFLSPDIHIMAVCQPTVPALAAAAIMSAEKDKDVPLSLTLMGGPVDARESPTILGGYAENLSQDWFEKYIISEVPQNFPGHGRKVYPGFMQLVGFMSMNWKKHLESHIDMFKNLLVEDDDKADSQKAFYDEYLSVMDLPAEFFIQTVKEVFKNFSLAEGKLISRGRKVDLQAITKCAIFGIEGEKDDIAGLGQTKAALEICTNVLDEKKQYYMQKDVGHYGVFSGSKFRKLIAPQISDFLKKWD